MGQLPHAVDLAGPREGKAGALSGVQGLREKDCRRLRPTEQFPSQRARPRGRGPAPGVVAEPPRAHVPNMRRK
eukprot:9492183-Pyramimonas_sp.AAC.1